MHDIFSPEPDPLDSMLRPPSAPDNQALQRAVYGQTRRLLRRRRRLRQIAYAAALAASFAAGLLVMRLLTPQSAPAPVPQPERAVKLPEKAPPPEKQPLSSVDESALAMEWDAFDSSEHRSERYQQAGDHYLNEEFDPQSALRCYRHALDNGTKQDLAISPSDNWLLMVIKDARQKEINHANQGG
jgi:hypothetical protein